MASYPEGYDVQVVVEFNDYNGDPITPDSLSAVLYDGDDNVLEDFGSIDPGAGTSQTILIPAPFNMLAEGSTQDARVLRVQIATAAGVIHRSVIYLIVAEQTLSVMGDSFMTYQLAELEALNHVNIAGWNAADPERRKVALKNAFRRLTNIPMRFYQRDANDMILRDTETIIDRVRWASVTAEEFAEFPAHFRGALRRAQFIEANELLQGDVTSRKIRSGIISETIGESSIRFAPGKIDFGIGSASMQALAGYVYYNMRIERA